MAAEMTTLHFQIIVLVLLFLAKFFRLGMHFFIIHIYKNEVSRRSIGNGKIIVRKISAGIVVSVCKYQSCRAAGDSAMISDASFRALEIFCSPSTAITLALACLPRTYLQPHYGNGVFGNVYLLVLSS